MNTTLAYLRRGGRTLMMRRDREGDRHRGKWNGLGGKFEPGESPEDCLRREVLEESGLEVRGARLKGVLTFPAFDGTHDVLTFVYLVTDFSGSLRSGAEGELHWVDDDELQRLPLWEGDRVFLPWLDRPGVFSGKFSYRDGRLVAHEAHFY